LSCAKQFLLCCSFVRRRKCIASSYIDIIVVVQNDVFYALEIVWSIIMIVIYKLMWKYFNHYLRTYLRIFNILGKRVAINRKKMIHNSFHQTQPLHLYNNRYYILCGTSKRVVPGLDPPPCRLVPTLFGNKKNLN